MWYKRYGYKGVRHSGAETFKVILVIPVVMLVCSGIAAFFRNPWLLLLIIPCSIAALEGMHRAVMRAGPKFHESRKNLHRQDAIKAYEMKNYEAAKESIRKAEIYGELPEELLDVKRKVQESENA